MIEEQVGTAAITLVLPAGLTTGAIDQALAEPGRDSVAVAILQAARAQLEHGAGDADVDEGVGSFIKDTIKEAGISGSVTVDIHIQANIGDGAAGGDSGSGDGSAAAGSSGGGGGGGIVTPGRNPRGRRPPPSKTKGPNPN